MQLSPHIFKFKLGDCLPAESWMPWRNLFIFSACLLDKKNPQNHDYGNSGRKKIVVTKIMMLKMMTIATMMRKMGLRIREGGLAPGGEGNGCHKKSHHCHTP